MEQSHQFKIKRDKYLAARGGTAKITRVRCAKCGKKIFLYQKDGPGWLKRCYINRIISDSFNSSNEHDESTLKNLTCDCGELIGTPMQHKDGRLAFKLVRGSFKRTNIKTPHST